jgi:hypothetical protein
MLIDCERPDSILKSISVLNYQLAEGDQTTLFAYHIIKVSDCFRRHVPDVSGPKCEIVLLVY